MSITDGSSKPEDKGKTEGKEGYPSAEILFNLAKGEYDYEANRKRDLETRAGIFLALIAAGIGIFVDKIDISLVLKGKTVIETIFYTLLIVIYIVPFAQMFLSLKAFIDVLTIRDYTRVDVSGISIESALENRDNLQYRLADSFKNAVISNELVNEDKVKHFKKVSDNFCFL